MSLVAYYNKLSTQFIPPIQVKLLGLSLNLAPSLVTSCSN